MNDLYSNCKLCPRECGTDRRSGRVGFCNSTDKVKISRAALHFWEEPCISGNNGSGTVFFSGCSLKCVYCQNRKISTGLVGKEITVGRLVDIFFELKEKGALNINLVTPSHFAPSVAEAIKRAKNEKVDLPFVFNTSGYEKEETLKEFDGLIDIYLPDFKYISESAAKKYSCADNYPHVVKNAIEEMVRQVGTPIFEDGIMKRGVIVRHLVLPGFYSDSKKIIKYLYETYRNDIFMSIMSQYTPFDLEKYPEINKHIDFNQYNEIIDYAANLGVENAFIQEEEADSKSFIPDFNCEGV